MHIGYCCLYDKCYFRKSFNIISTNGIIYVTLFFIAHNIILYHEKGTSLANESQLSFGIKLQKTHTLYYENGIIAEYSSSAFLGNNFHSGFSYITSRFGTAFNSNALKQDNFLLHTSYTFLKKAILNPFIKVKAGFIIADYQSPLFDEIDNRMPLTSIDLGFSYTPIIPLKAQVSLGYNIITSDGTKGVGTLYPLYFNFIVMWNILK
jgi:hypothetical protein